MKMMRRRSCQILENLMKVVISNVTTERAKAMTKGAMALRTVRMALMKRIVEFAQDKNLNAKAQTNVWIIPKDVMANQIVLMVQTKIFAKVRFVTILQKLVNNLVI